MEQNIHFPYNNVMYNFLLVFSCTLFALLLFMRELDAYVNKSVSRSIKMLRRFG